MNRFSIALCAALVVSSVSCIDEPQIKPESAYKEAISRYYDALGEQASKKEEIEILKKSIDFRDVREYQLRTNEKALVAKVNDLENFEEGEMVVALLMMNEGVIVRSYLVSFDEMSRFNLFDRLLVSVINMHKVDVAYSGRMTVYNPFQQLLMFNTYDNGRLTEHGQANKLFEQSDENKANGCTEWYLITTTYYSDGSTSTSADYLYTTCTGGSGGCEQTETRVGKTMCGGGAWGTGVTAGTAPSIPSNPRDGDTYDYTGRDGGFFKYIYNKQQGIWVVVECILPPIVVYNEPENYPFLMIQYPVHNQVVYGTDYMIYTYDGGSGSWHGEYCIENQLTTPCLSNTADKVLNPNLASTYNNLIQDVFNKNDKVNLTLKEGPLEPDKTAKTSPLTSVNGIINIDITLDPAKLLGGSQEYVAAVIYHECFHALIKSLSNNSYPSDDQHVAMFTTYLNLLASGLHIAYPNMQPGDGKGLILAGLLALDGGAVPTKSDQWSTSFVDKVLSKTGFTRTQVTNVYRRYQVFKISGLICN